MRILGDLGSLVTGSPAILQSEKTPAINDPVPFNGKYSISVLDGTFIEVDGASYILPVDGGDVTSESYANLLAQFPMYEFVYYNPLLIDDHVGELDLTGTWVDSNNDTFPTRAQTGRETGPTSGLAPNSTAILPVNTTVTPNRPGVLVTAPIDISAQTGGVGADDFLVYWKIYEFETSQDVRSEYGKLAGQNSPAIRSIKEVDQEPAGFQVYFSTSDSCLTWTPVGLMQQIGFCAKTTMFRLAFVNTSSTKIYLATYGVLF